MWSFCLSTARNHPQRPLLSPSGIYTSLTSLLGSSFHTFEVSVFDLLPIRHHEGSLRVIAAAASGSSLSHDRRRYHTQRRRSTPLFIHIARDT